MHRLDRLVLVLAVVFASALLPRPGVAAPSYSVALSASRTSLEATESTTLTTVANRDLTGTKWIVYVFDQTDPTWYRRCKVQTCSFDVTQSTPGTHTYIAYIARDRPDPRYPPMQIQAASEPVSVTWSAGSFTVTLAADRTWLRPGSTAVLTADTNKDVAGRTVAIQIFDVTSGDRVALCTSGTQCIAFVEQVSPTTRSYQAFVAEPGATTPPPGIQATSNVVSITWSVLPDPTRPPNIGGGDVTGAVRFDEPGLPPPGSICDATHFTFEGASESAWVNGSGAAYVGSLGIVASGGSDCETSTAGSGTLVVSASGASALGTLVCGPLEGTFTRVATDVTIEVSGHCEVGGFAAFGVRFIAKGEFVPTSDPVTSAVFAGGFVVLPT